MKNLVIKKLEQLDLIVWWSNFSKVFELKSVKINPKPRSFIFKFKNISTQEFYILLSIARWVIALNVFLIISVRNRIDRERFSTIIKPASVGHLMTVHACGWGFTINAATQQ